MARFLCGWQLVEGGSVLTTDQGKEFNNKVNSKLMRVFGIKHRLTTAYHPQANGLDECFNHTLANSLAKFAQVNRDSWDECLGAVVYAYNSPMFWETKDGNVSIYSKEKVEEVNGKIDSESSSVLQLQDARDGRMHDRVYYL